MKFYIILVLILHISFEYCLGQNLKKIIIPTRVESDKPEENDGVYIGSQGKKSVTLIFEQEFNDSVVICLNGQQMYQSKVKTLHPLGVCLENFELKRSSSTDKISIYFVEKNICLDFVIKEKKVVCYLNIDDGQFDIVLSNFARTYPPL